MNHSSHRFGWLTAAILFGQSNLIAAPPSVSSLNPGGLQRGTQTEITLNGKPGKLPLSVWTESTGLTDFQFSEKGDKLTLSASAEIPAGVHWIRIYNDEGTTSPLPLIIGTLPDVKEVEPNNSVTEAQKISELPAAVNGLLHKGGEVDTFSISLKEGETLIASIDSHEALAAPTDCVLQILDAKGFVISQNDDDHGFDPLLQFVAPRTDDYLVRVFCFPATPNSTINFAGGTDYVYRLSMTTGPFVTFAPTPDQTALGWNLAAENASDLPAAGLPEIFAYSPKQEVLSESKLDQTPLTVPVTIAGTIQQPREADKFSIAAKKGESWRIRVRARDIATLLDPVVRIRKSDGSLIKEDDDLSRTERDVDFLWKAPADETYLVEVVDRYQHGGFRFDYLLEVSLETPRVELSLAADNFLLPRDKPLEIPVTVARFAGFSKPVSITVSNLPEGVTCEAVTSEPKGDSAKKVVLKLSAQDAAGFQGPIQITGTISDEDSVLATANLSTLKITTTQIWLTIPPKPEPKAAE